MTTMRCSLSLFVLLVDDALDLLMSRSLVLRISHLSQIDLDSI